MPTVACDGCRAERDAKPGKHADAKLPRGYKVLGGRTLCEDCRDARYVLRAVTVPVSGALDPDGDDLRPAVFRAWGWATNAANAIVTELARHERPRRTERGVRLDTPPKLNTYQVVRAVEPDMDPASVAGLDQAVRGRYGKSRINVFCRGVEALPVYRFPTPYPVRKTEWEASVRDPGGERCVRARFGNRWWTLKLIVDGRQSAAFAQLVSGEAERCEMSILGRAVTESDERPGLRMRLPGKHAKRTARVMARLVGWFPRRGPNDGEARVLYCETQADRLWMYRIGERGEPRFLNADHVGAIGRQQSRRTAEIDLIARRHAGRHAERVDRMADDTKHEKRWPKRRRRKLLAGQEARVRKFRDRMDTFTHEASKMLAEFARRNRVTAVVYDDRERSFSDRFPYYQLAERLAYKLHERSIAFEHVRGKDDDR